MVHQNGLQYKHDIMSRVVKKNQWWIQGTFVVVWYIQSGLVWFSQNLPTSELRLYEKMKELNDVLKGWTSTFAKCVWIQVFIL
jgi:hypothetical protein